jgi:uncharacterized membrane protein
MPSGQDRRSVVDRLIQTFITGVMGVLPLALTFAVLAWVVVFLHDLAGPASAFGRLLRSAGMTITACEVLAYTIGLFGTVFLVYGLGLAAEHGGNLGWKSTFDKALQRVPLLGTVYDASKNVTSVFDRRGDSLKGMTPVVCYFGGDRNAATPALMPTSQPVRLNGQEYHVVIIPTAPVPFGGALLCVKADWVEPAACGLDEMIGVYMSMGVSAPRCLSRDVINELETIRHPTNDAKGDEQP